MEATTPSPPEPQKTPGGNPRLRSILRRIARRLVPLRMRQWVNRLLGRHRTPLANNDDLSPAQQLRKLGRMLRSSQELLLRHYLSPRTGYDLIVLPVISWDFRFQRPQHLARRLAQDGTRVFFASTTFEGKKLSLRPLLPNLVEVQLPGPGTLNLYQHSASEAVVEGWLRALEKLAEEQGIREAVCVVQLPFWADLAFRLRERLGWQIVYDCMDKHSGFSTNRPFMLAHEEQLTRQSDLVVTTARVLQQEQEPLARRCVLIPNGCELEHFAPDPGRVPPELASLRRPVIGYFGAISDWFDGEMVSAVARRRPDWTFVLVGSTYGADLQPFHGLKNVRLLGERPYTDLPSYLHSFDVCLIPFKITPLTEATNPVKYFEYLCAGKPVVASRLPELEPFAHEDGLVYLAGSAEEMLAHCETALAEGTRPAACTLSARRREVAGRNTWQARATALREAIAGLFPPVSLIVLTYNNLGLNRLCIESILRNTGWPNYELIVVDNASTDGTPDYLRSLALAHPHVRILLNDRNAGFAGGNNQGIQAAGGEYVVLLNNDTIVTPGWLGRLVRHLREDPTIGLIGPVTNGAANEAFVPVDYSSLEEMDRFAVERSRSRAGRTFPIRVPALFCAAIRRDLLERIGLLDVRYEIGMFEDDDFALRVQQAGYRTVCAEDVFIHHYQSEGFKILGDETYLKLFEANRRRFEAKWNVRWQPHSRRSLAG